MTVTGDASQRLGELSIELDPSLAATTIDGLTYLQNYPYQCIEQTVSRFLPNIMTYRALASLNLDDGGAESAAGQQRQLCLAAALRRAEG